MYVPKWFRSLFHGIMWNSEETGSVVHLTFDDGPIPEVTPWVLNLLDEYNQKATFFCVGENVNKYPEIYSEIISRGHTVGNHTFHHLNGWKVKGKKYLADISKADVDINSNLFRPPYGKLTFGLYRKLKNQKKIVMWTFLSGDFEKSFNADLCFVKVQQHSVDGAILVFHDSIKAKHSLQKILPQILAYYREKNILSKAIQQNYSPLILYMLLSAFERI